MTEPVLTVTGTGPRAAFDVDTGIEASPYQGYTYAYPHKSAYRRLDPPIPLDRLWTDEDRSALFGYVHIPFCEMRCGFCNLFTVARPPSELAEVYVTRLLDQMGTTARILGGDATYARLAIGGGTPTMLEADQLDRVLTGLRAIGADPSTAPLSVESSPATATPDRLQVLADHDTTRISIGIQTFDQAESKRLARPQSPAAVEAALEAIRSSGIPEMNLDLIYGIDGQTADSFIASIDRALTYAPTELYLYPLYVRPLTGLGLSRRRWDDHRQNLYRAGRDHLVANGFSQISMRCFRAATSAEAGEVIDYTCQEDGMVGLGVGARSYTTGLHYSSDYAVSRSETLGVIDRYLADPAGDTVATHGIALDDDDRRRRDVIKSILRVEGLDVDRFAARFGLHPDEAVPELARFRERGWIADRSGDGGGRTIEPTAEGLAWSDHLGPALTSARIRALSDEFEAR